LATTAASRAATIGSSSATRSIIRSTRAKVATAPAGSRLARCCATRSLIMSLARRKVRCDCSLAIVAAARSRAAAVDARTQDAASPSSASTVMAATATVRGCLRASRRMRSTGRDARAETGIPSSQRRTSSASAAAEA
jgi:hypothetical protein